MSRSPGRRVAMALLRGALRTAGATSAWLGHACVAHAAGPLSLGEDPIDPYAVPDAPAPPTLLDLTHRANLASLETTLASIRGNARPDGSEPGRSFGWTERLEVEQALALRRWYVGVAEQLALGKGADQFRLVAGNPEVWGRALWASQAGLAYGGGLGLVLPGIHHGGEALAVAESIRVVRPWDYVDFGNGDLVLRPFIDVRDIDGPVMLQLRQGIDWNLANQELTSRTTFYVGYRPTEVLGLGLELWEVYVIRAVEKKDEGSAAYAVSPSVRFMTRVLQPAVSFLMPIDRALFGAVDNFWAVRLSLNVIIEGKSESR